MYVVFSYTSQQITLTRNTRNTNRYVCLQSIGIKLLSGVTQRVNGTEVHRNYEITFVLRYVHSFELHTRGTSRQHRNLLRTDLLDSRSFGYRVPKYYTIDKTFRNKRKLRHMVSVCKIVRQFFRAVRYETKRKDTSHFICDSKCE